MSTALKAADLSHQVSEDIARLLRPYLTKQVGLKAEIVKVADEELEAQNVAVQFRPKQPRRKPL